MIRAEQTNAQTFHPGRWSRARLHPRHLSSQAGPPSPPLNLLFLFHAPSPPHSPRPLTRGLLSYLRLGLNSLSPQISLTRRQPTRVCVSHPVVQRFQQPPPAPLRTSQRLGLLPYSSHPWDMLHESRYPHMCRYADPVSVSRIGCLLRFNRCSLARRGVDYICMVQRRASQLTHGINREGKKIGA